MGPGGTVRREERMALGLISVLMVLVAGVACGAPLDQVETWDSGDAEGWVEYDPLNQRTLQLCNPSNYVQAVFKKQTRSFPAIHFVRADANSSGGIFVGDYCSARVTGISFKVYCETHLPADLRLYICSGRSGSWWYYRLKATEVGKWQEYHVSLAYEAGWSVACGSTYTGFRLDLSDVIWIGLEFERNSSLNRQVYRLDDFTFHHADTSTDSDNDGLTDWNEFVAGTDPNDPESLLKVGTATATGPGIAASGEEGSESTEETVPTLQWTSSANRTYAVLRATDLTQGFTKIASGIAATIPVNTYRDETATGSGPYFYKIAVE